ncbi:MAG: leucyl aminopeptidase [Microbacteriaceae bacterium]|nr:leucyl aminopeptidase [Microbacteriaceae bacterium]
MSFPDVSISNEPITTIDCDVLVLGIQQTDQGPLLLADDPAFSPLAKSLTAIGVTGAEEEVSRVPGIGAARSIALIGLGKGEIDDRLLRRVAGAAVRHLTGAEHVVIYLPFGSTSDIRGTLEGAAIAAYSFNKFRSSSQDASKLPASKITIVTSLESEKALDDANAIATAVHTVRDLVNTPPSHLYPETFADAIRELAVAEGLKVEVLSETELEAGGYGGILGVGQGSIRGPRLVKISYSPVKAKRHIAFVGKGITFDSGGLSLKPPASMVGMKYDMTGAATVGAVTIATAKLKLPVRITAWLCIAENLPSGSSIRPNDVLFIHGGKTVEVLNTDAEGRLVMADGLAAASKEQPDAIIDVATLTGAQRVALGDRYVGTMGDEGLVSKIVDISKQVGEQFWPMPLPAELRQLLNSDVADIANVKIGSTAAGMLVAGVFLQEFVGTAPDGSRIPWAHLDIAGPANNEGSPYGYTSKGPTGVAVRTLIEFAEQFSHS